MNSKLPKRKSLRLSNYDYSQNGYYFVTICVANKRPILSHLIVGTVAHDCPQPADVKVRLTETGRIVEKYIKRTEKVYDYIFVDKYVIMPDHIHLILVIDVPYGASRAMHPTLSQVVSSLKRLVVKDCGKRIWQGSFYERVIRTQREYEKTWYYIDFNPLREIKGEKLNYEEYIK